MEMTNKEAIVTNEGRKMEEVMIGFSPEDLETIMEYKKVSGAVTVQAAIMNAVSLALDHADDVDEECISDCFEPWDVLWEATDGTFKGRCDNCGFVHVFIESHVRQYKFCPQCGEQKQEL